MGKVLEKLAKLPAVKSLTEGSDGIAIVLADGRETVVKTAHAARLFIQGDKPKAQRTASPTSNDNGEGIIVPLVSEIRVPRYPGLKLAAERDGEEYIAVPIWEREKGFEPNAAEGKDAFRRGYERSSHYKGDSSAAKDFELAWDAVKREAEVKADADA